MAYFCTLVISRFQSRFYYLGVHDPVYGIKARNVGKKYWLSVDKESKYLVNAFRYIGKVETRHVNERASDHIVMQLMQPYLNKGRNVTTNNCFTSVRLATQLKEKQTSLLETLNKVRQELPLFL